MLSVDGAAVTECVTTARVIVMEAIEGVWEIYVGFRIYPERQSHPSLSCTNISIHFILLTP
jgi:hypothetical protein